jgi:hypothetical protein
MHFDTKNYLKNNHNHTLKYSQKTPLFSSFWRMIKKYFYPGLFDPRALFNLSLLFLDQVHVIFILFYKVSY